MFCSSLDVGSLFCCTAYSSPDSSSMYIPRCSLLCGLCSPIPRLLVIWVSWSLASSLVFGGGGGVLPGLAWFVYSFMFVFVFEVMYPVGLQVCVSFLKDMLVLAKAGTGMVFLEMVFPLLVSELYDMSDIDLNLFLLSPNWGSSLVESSVLFGV